MKNLTILFLILISTTTYSQTEEDWQLQLPEGVLKGTLLMPELSQPKVVLIIAGSGPTDRDGNNTVAKNNSLKMLAEALANKNIASLRIDKRGIGQSKMKSFKETDISFDDFINDAVKWIDTLKQTQKFGQIWVAGHSQGSLVGMIVAKRAKADGFISLAGAGSNIGDVIKQQLAHSAKPIKDFAYKAIDSLQMGKKISNVPPLLFSLFRPSIQPFWITWMQYNPQKEIKKLQIPVLIINGTTDLQVSVEEAKKLHKANPLSKLVIIEGMNHILKKAPKERVANLKTYAQPDLPLHQELLPTVINFIIQD
jgi:pimeloyl-ACP methyl ester carboxylesterase